MDGQAAAGEVSDTALPTLSDDLNQLLADIGADLIMSARSRPPPPQHAQLIKRSNRRTDSRQRANNAGAATGDAALTSQHESGNQQSDGETTGEASSSGRKARTLSTISAAATVTRSPRTSLVAATRSHSHSLHRASLLHQLHQHPRSRAPSIMSANEHSAEQSPSAAATLLTHSRAVERSHARHSSLQLLPSAHSRQAVTSSARTRTALAQHSRTRTQ